MARSTSVLELAVLLAVSGVLQAGDRVALLHDRQAPAHQALVDCRKAIKGLTARTGAYAAGPSGSKAMEVQGTIARPALSKQSLVRPQQRAASGDGEVPVGRWC